MSKCHWCKERESTHSSPKGTYGCCKPCWDERYFECQASGNIFLIKWLVKTDGGKSVHDKFANDWNCALCSKHFKEYERWVSYVHGGSNKLITICKSCLKKSREAGDIRKCKECGAEVLSTKQELLPLLPLIIGVMNTAFRQ